jgi:2,3-bisphosphoglycerate-dependent phosphoglycerate mutase
MPANFPEPTRIIAIRHGETAWNVNTRIQGQLDVGLNETGRWQAHRVALALAGEPIKAIYSSDLLRAWDTALSIANATGLPVQTVEGLRERGFGVFEGKTFQEVEAQWPEQALRWRKREPAFEPEGGESLLRFRERITKAVQALAVQHPGEQIVVVAHGGVMDVLYRAATRQEIQAPRTWDLGNATINRLLWTPEGLSLVGWADTQHLDDDEALDESTA